MFAAAHVVAFPTACRIDRLLRISSAAMHFFSRSVPALIVAAVLLMMTGCDSGETSDGLVRGISWKKDRTNVYDRSYAAIDSTGEPIFHHEGRYATRVSANRDRIGEWTDLIKLEAYHVDDEDDREMTWYRETEADLREVAHIVSPMVPIVQPKRDAAEISIGPPSVYGMPITVKTLLGERLAKGGDADSVQIRTDPRIVLVYPLEKGAAWTSFTKPFLQTREVTGYKDVTVKAGTFRCAEIVTRMPELAPKMEWIDYVSEIGLVLRTVTNEHDQRDPQGNPFATFRTEERLELIARGR